MALDIKEADKKAALAQQTGDIAHIDEAIKIRKNDYGYVNERGVLLAMQGQPESIVRGQWDAADNLARRNNPTAPDLAVRAARLNRLNALDTYLQAHDKWPPGYSTPAGIASTAAAYCEQARLYQQQTGDASYRERRGC
jgi:hypothetical protein